jgi:hypothetical protein
MGLMNAFMKLHIIFTVRKGYPNHYPDVRLNSNVMDRGIYKAEFLADFFKDKGFNIVDATMLAIKAHSLCSNTPPQFVFKDLIRDKYKINFACDFEKFCLDCHPNSVGDSLLWRSQEVGFEDNKPVLYKKFANFLPNQGAWWGFNKSLNMGEKYFILTGSLNLLEENTSSDFECMSWNMQFYNKNEIQSDFFSESIGFRILKKLNVQHVPDFPITLEGERIGKSVFINGKLPAITLPGSYESD